MSTRFLNGPVAREGVLAGWTAEHWPQAMGVAFPPIRVQRIAARMQCREDNGARGRSGVKRAAAGFVSVGMIAVVSLLALPAVGGGEATARGYLLQVSGMT